MASPFIMRKGANSLSDLRDGPYAALASLKGVAGKIFYVDAGHSDASDSNDGDDPSRPLSTIATAYARCTADVGDVIYVTGERRYRENQLTIEKDGIRIVGGGWGTEWNRTSSQTGTYVVAVQAKDVHICNIQISVNGGEKGLYWGDGGASDDNASLGLLENCFIRGNWYSAAGSEGDVGITIDGSSMGPMIRGNYIWGWTTGIDVSDGSSRTAYGVHIHDNFITGKTYGINWSGYGYTSSICRNYIWDWKSSVNMTAGINLAPSVGGILVAGNFVGSAVYGADSGDLNYWVGNFARETEAASEDLSVAMAANDATVT